PSSAPYAPDPRLGADELHRLHASATRLEMTARFMPSMQERAALSDAWMRIEDIMAEGDRVAVRLTSHA
ncbi:MAG: hypothetical protein ACRDGJ_06235, partial [Candidatus Limnocylindria bacterium]